MTELGSVMFALRGGGIVPLENPGLGIRMTAVGCVLRLSLALALPLCPRFKGSLGRQRHAPKGMRYAAGEE